MNNKMASANAVKLELCFNEVLQLQALPYKWRKQYSKDIYDDIAVDKNKISIEYRRLSSSGKNRAFNKTRVTYIQSALLALSSCEGVPFAPTIASASYSINNGDAEELPLPDELLNLKLDQCRAHFSENAIGRSFGDDWLAKSIRIAISYCWAASMAFSQEERLKLLWGSFNAIYRGYAYFKEPGKKSIPEQKMLDYMNNLLIENCVLDRALKVFNDELEPLGYREFVQWRVLTGERCKALHIYPNDTRQKEKAKRLAALDSETLRYMRDCGCREYKSKVPLRDAIDKQLASNDNAADPVFKIAMLLCRYIYIFRCDAVHANNVYPVFGSQADGGKEVLADLLEAAIVDLSEWLSNNIA